MSIYIYKLYNANDCYKGSTKHPLHKRLSQHKSPHNRCCSKLIIEQGDYQIEIIAEVDAEERLQKEQEYIDALSTLNQHTCYSPYRDNYHRQYFLAHRTKTTCNCGGVYTYDHRARHFKSQKHINFIGV
jgi:hypothetical protein